MSSVSSSCYSIEQYSNLESFLHSVTPIINPIVVSQDQVNGESDNAHIKLQDIWEIYDEWSSCGVGTPVLLSNGQNIVQYYVPYLSAIQIFTKSTPTSSEDGIDSHHDANIKAKNDDPDKEVTCNGYKRDNGCLVNDNGHLYLQFYETCSPYSRVPLLDKIVELAQNYPGLLTIDIDDISPASWMSIAWYPIYHIPAWVYSTKDLSTCFLTFHTLSSSFQDNNEEGEKDDNNENGEVYGEEQSKDFKNINLFPFGLATYKMQGDVWNNRDKGNDEKMENLESAASSWLKQLKIQHPDFIFFTQ